MASPVKGNYVSVMTDGWWTATGVIVSGVATTTSQIIYRYVQVPTRPYEPEDLTLDITDSTIQDDNTIIGIIPASGVRKTENRFSLTYNGDTEWYFTETPYPRLKRKGNMTLFDFHEIMKQTLEILDNEIAYVPSYPDFILTNEDESYIADTRQSPKKIITYQTIRSEPGKISAGPPFQGGGVREIKKRVREQLFLDPLFRKDIDDPADKLKYFKTEAQWFDNLVQFDLWTKTNYEAEEFIEWFENILDKYRGMFKELGIQEMVYYRRVRDDTIIKWKNKLTVRSLIYYFRTEKINITEIKPIRRINVTTHLTNYDNLYNQDALRYDEQRILKKWLNRKS